MNEYNPYLVLGLSEQADISEIKERYRELSKVFHPDKQSA
jgi:curved DNA-binding protein CbpA